MSLALGLPVAADLNLSIGGSADVSYTNGDGVNVRSDPGYGAGILTTLQEGTQVTVQDGPVTNDDGSSWFYVSADTYDGTIEGWVIADYLSDGSGTQTKQADSTDGSAAAADSAASAVVAGTDGNGLRLRDGASTDAAVLTVMPEGASVSVLASEIADDAGTLWSQVDYDGTTGYSASAYLAVGGSAPESASAAPVAADASATDAGLSVGVRAEVVGTDGAGLNLRYESGFGAGVMAVMPEGERVTVLDGPATDDAGNGWYQVEDASMTGWVNGAYLAVAADQSPVTAPTTAVSDPAPAEQAPVEAAPAEPAPTEQPPAAEAPAAPVAGVGASIVAEALNYVGLPYVWGGTTPAGFDCSGFIYYVLNRVAGDFPRDMASQVASGSYVTQDALQPGDLVFFQNTYKWGLSHSGIYIGDGQFVNAGSERTGVTISNMGDSYWSSRYYTARRVGA